MFHWLEKRPFLFAVGVFIAIAIAGLIEVLPDFAKAAQPLVGTKPYTILQLAGREIYIHQDCNGCHSQLIRPFKSETERYGHYSLSGEYAYDRPFLWGSERTGPDLHRVADYRTVDWNEKHLKDPEALVPGSIMPPYPWLYDKMTDIATAYASQVANWEFFHVPYNKPIPTKEGGTVVVPMASSLQGAREMALKEAKAIVAKTTNKQLQEEVAQGKIPQIVALLAYLNDLK
jgi:cytochrome c oxidase cbb3-type subunit II